MLFFFAMVQRYTFYLNNVLFGGVVRVICGGSIHGLLQLSLNNAEDEENNTLFVDNGFVCCFGSSAHISSVGLFPEWQAEDVGVHWQLVAVHSVL